MRISDWSSDVCSSDLLLQRLALADQLGLAFAYLLQRRLVPRLGLGQRLLGFVEPGPAGAGSRFRRRLCLHFSSRPGRGPFLQPSLRALSPRRLLGLPQSRDLLGRRSAPALDDLAGALARHLRQPGLGDQFHRFALEPNPCPPPRPAPPPS